MNNVINKLPQSVSIPENRLSFGSAVGEKLRKITSPRKSVFGTPLVEVMERQRQTGLVIIF